MGLELRLFERLGQFIFINSFRCGTFASKNTFAYNIKGHFAVRTYFIIILLLIFIVPSAYAGGSNLRTRSMRLTADTMLLDSLSIAPRSVLAYHQGQLLSDSLMRIDYVHGYIIAPQLKDEEISISYRVFPSNFSKPYMHRQLSIGASDSIPNRRLSNGEGPQPTLDEPTHGVNTTGSIARGISVGNSQDIVLNSSMNLQMEGFISDNIQISAAVSDQNIPIQPEGNTQQISEFDKVYIKLFNGGNAAIFGDFESANGQGDFLRYNKKGLGARGETDIELRKKLRMRGDASFALSKGKYCRLDIVGMEGSQGPYRVYGCGGEAFIIILSGSERVYLDGRLMQRGENLDYTIDYNAGELSFTPKQPITKDSRIAIEFEYSEQSYARFFVTENLSFAGKHSTSWVNIYSEQDNRNQPFQQDTLGIVNDALYRAGDGTVLVPNVMEDTVWDANKIYYSLRDTILDDGRSYDSIYVYSNSMNGGRYILGFSYVGAGKGNYRRATSAANGKVYEWVAPKSTGTPSGEYLPVRIVSAPQKTQVISSGTRVKLTPNTELRAEGSVSNRDKNTASPYGNDDNTGGAASIGATHYFPLDSLRRIGIYANYQLVNDNYEAVGAFRPVEFARDWSVSTKEKADEQLITGGLKYESKAVRADISQSTFIRSALFNGNKQSASIAASKGGLKATADGSILNADAKASSAEYYRAKSDISQKIWLTRLGILGEYELLDKRDTLQKLMNDAQAFIRYGTYLQQADSGTTLYKLSLVRRYDKRPDSLYHSFIETTNSTDYSADLGLYRNENHTFAIGGTYRILRTTDSAWSRTNSIAPENNLTARMEHNLALWKSAVRNRLFLETGSGLELKRDYNYVEVTPGQGSYQWVDYNGNGIPELNEFELAQYQQQANYMRVFLASNEYVRVYSNTFGHTFTADPYSIWRNANGWRRYAARLSLRSNYSFGRKIDRTDFWQNMLPGQLFHGDAQVQSLQSNYRATAAVNKPNHLLSGSYSYTASKNLLLSSNGTEQRNTEENSADLRWNISDMISAFQRAAIGTQTSEMEAAFLSNREYHIEYYMLVPKLELQPGPNLVVDAEYLYRQKLNKSDSAEQCIENNITAQIRYSHPKQGRFAAKFSTVFMKYNGITGTALSYTMLESLEPGRNFVWELQFGRNLTQFLNLSISYNGQKSEGTRPLHLGTVQMKAFF